MRYEQSLIRMLTMEKEKARQARSKWSRQHEDSSSDADYHDAQERENRRKAQELVEKRDTIRTGGYTEEEEARRLRELSDEYSTDVRRKADKIEELKTGDAERLREIKAAKQDSIDASQTKSGEADFMASASALTGAFERASTNATSETPDALPALRRAATGSAPSA